MHFSLFSLADDRRTVGNGFMESKYNNPQVLSCTQKTILKKLSKWKCLELAEFHGLEFLPIS